MKRNIDIRATDVAIVLVSLYATVACQWSIDDTRFSVLPARPDAGDPSIRADLGASDGGGGSDAAAPLPGIVIGFQSFRFTRGPEEHPVADPARGLLRDDATGLLRVVTDEPNVSTDRGGVVVLAPDGTFTYRPPTPSVFWGDDGFAYAVTNGVEQARGRARLTVAPGLDSLTALREGGNGSVLPQSGGNFVALAVAGDVDGRGRADFVVRRVVGGDAATCVVFGEDVAVGVRDLGDCSATGFAIRSSFDGVARLAGAGDVNGDGLDDILVADLSSQLNGNDSGAVYVVYGKSDRALLDLAELETGTGSKGFVIIGDSEYDVGTHVASAGDFDDDGYADVLVGAGEAGAAGSVFVVFGAAGGGNVVLTRDIDRSIAIAGGEVATETSPEVLIGDIFSPAGDVNGDGIDDIVIGSPNSNRGGERTGAVYVVFGRPGRAAISLRDFETTSAGGFVRYGRQGEHAGAAVAGVADYDGDGHDDIAYFAPGEIMGTTAVAGELRVIFGWDDGGVPIAPAAVGQVDAEPRDSLAISSALNPLGTSVTAADAGYELILANAGDFNGDGLGDLVAALPANDGDRGVAMVALGEVTRRSRSLRAVLAGDDPSTVLFEGETAAGRAGVSLSGAGDIDGNGLDDVLIGAGSGNIESSTSYLLLGWDVTNSLENRAPALLGNAQDNTLVYAAPAVRVNGGHGVDTLVVAAGDLDLRGRQAVFVRSIEHMDARGAGSTRILLDEAALRRIPESRRELPASLSRILSIEGGSDDRVEMTDPGGLEPSAEPRLYRVTGTRYGIQLSGAITSNWEPGGP